MKLQKHVPIEIDIAEAKRAELIFAAKNGDGYLDYLQCIHDIQLNRGKSGVIFFQQQLPDLEAKFAQYIDSALENVLSIFSEHNPPFDIDAIFTPLTQSFELQKPVLDIFRNKFDVVYFNEFVTPIGNTNNFTVNHNAPDVQRILIIDDVYGKGATVRNVVSTIGQHKFYIVVCLLASHLDKSNTTSNLISEANELIKKKFSGTYRHIN